MKPDYVVTVHSDLNNDHHKQGGTQRIHCEVAVHTPQLFKVIQRVKRADLSFHPYTPNMEQEAPKKNVLHFVLTAQYPVGNQDSQELLQFLRALGWKFAEQLALYLYRKQFPATQHIDYQGDLEW